MKNTLFISQNEKGEYAVSETPTGVGGECEALVMTDAASSDHFLIYKKNECPVAFLNGVGIDLALLLANAMCTSGYTSAIMRAAVGAFLAKE